MSDYNYYLEHPIFGKKEVTEEEWLQAERAAGFHSKNGEGPATGGFRGHEGVSGSLRLKEDLTRLNLVKLYPDKRTLRDDLIDQGIL